MASQYLPRTNPFMYAITVNSQQSEHYSKIYQYAMYFTLSKISVVFDSTLRYALVNGSLLKVA